MKSQVATSEKRVREVEKNVQEEMWQFIAGTIKQGLKQFMENLLEDEITSILKAEKYERSSEREGHRGGSLSQRPGYSLRSGGGSAGAPGGGGTGGFAAL